MAAGEMQPAAVPGGMGQFTDFQRSEADGCAATLAAAKADGNEEAVAALQAIAPFPDREHPERNLQNLGVERLWLADKTRFKLPVFLFRGRHDRGTTSELAAEWFENVEAPRKRLVRFEDFAHMVYEEEPGKTLVSLVTEVLPLARSAPKSR